MFLLLMTKISFLPINYAQLGFLYRPLLWITRSPGCLKGEVASLPSAVFYLSEHSWSCLWWHLVWVHNAFCRLNSPHLNPRSTTLSLSLLLILASQIFKWFIAKAEQRPWALYMVYSLCGFKVKMYEKCFVLLISKIKLQKQGEQVCYVNNSSTSKRFLWPTSSCPLPRHETGSKRRSSWPTKSKEGLCTSSWHHRGLGS